MKSQIFWNQRNWLLDSKSDMEHMAESSCELIRTIDLSIFISAVSGRFLILSGTQEFEISRWNHGFIKSTAQYHLSKVKVNIVHARSMNCDWIKRRLQYTDLGKNSLKLWIWTLNIVRNEGLRQVAAKPDVRVVR